MKRWKMENTIRRNKQSKSGDRLFRKETIVGSIEIKTKDIFGNGKREEKGKDQDELQLYVISNIIGL